MRRFSASAALPSHHQLPRTASPRPPPRSRTDSDVRGGSYAGGSLWAVLAHDKFDLRKASTFIGAIVGSVIVLLVWRLFAGRRR